MAAPFTSSVIPPEGRVEVTPSEGWGSVAPGFVTPMPTSLAAYARVFESQLSSLLAWAQSQGFSA